MTDYGRIHLTEEDIRERRYARYLGGGEAQWDLRGAFQLELLRELGLRADHSLSRASIYDHGWAPSETVFPVLEFGLGGAS